MILTYLYHITFIHHIHIEDNKYLTTYFTLLLVSNNVVIMLSSYTYVCDDDSINFKC